MADQDERRFGGYEHNVYYNPEAGGLTLIGELDDENASYSYDTLIVLRDDVTGDLYAVADSGCSCPTPFEDVRSFADMTPIKTLDELKTFVKSHGNYHNWPSTQRQKLYRQVRKALIS